MSVDCDAYIVYGIWVDGSDIMEINLNSQWFNDYLSEVEVDISDMSEDEVYSWWESFIYDECYDNVKNTNSYQEPEDQDWIIGINCRCRFDGEYAAKMDTPENQKKVKEMAADILGHEIDDDAMPQFHVFTRWW